MTDPELEAWAWVAELPQVRILGHFPSWDFAHGAGGEYCLRFPACEVISEIVGVKNCLQCCSSHLWFACSNSQVMNIPLPYRETCLIIDLRLDPNPARERPAHLESTDHTMYFNAQGEHPYKLLSRICSHSLQPTYFPVVAHPCG